jgi:DNA-binding CsgD family transcriptional regulator
MSASSHETGSGAHLRPIERTMLNLVRAGKTKADIAWRLRRSPGHVRRTLALARIPRVPGPERQRAPWDLRPIERAVMRSRENGVPEAEIAARLRRSPAFVQRVSAFAEYKLAQTSKEVPQ